jgi:PAS domain S-box-containing protein
VLLDLPDADELESLSKSLAGAGLGAFGLFGGNDLAETLRGSGADFVLVDACIWPELVASLPRQPRSYIIIVLIDPSEEGRVADYFNEGAFDYLVRDGEGWTSRAAIYFRALSSLRKRFFFAFGALERRYEDLVHALPDIVYELDSEGRITFINNSIRLLGYEPSELAGKHFSVLLSESDAKAVDREDLLELFRGSRTGPALSPKLFNERRAMPRCTENLEVRLRRKSKAAGDSDVIATVISYGEITAAGEYAESEGGAFVGSVGVIRDITLRRKSEDMLRKLYQAVDQLTAGVLVVDHDFLVEYVNPAFLRSSGLTPQQVLCADLFSLFEISPSRAEEIRGLIQDGFEVKDELGLKTSAGNVLWIAIHGSPVRSPSGDISHASFICEDMSQMHAIEEILRLAKEEAERASKAKSDFLASMGAELKSPIAGILAAARLIEMGAPAPERRARSIISSAKGLLDMIGDILDFVHFEAGTAAIDRMSFSLPEFIEKTAAPYREAAAAKGLSFQMGPLPQELIHSDPERLGRALAALLDNAVAYTAAGSVSLEASVEKQGGNLPHLLLSVSDTGSGIPPDKQGRIFSPFVKLSEPESSNGGIGIGLALSRSIVRALGGEIRVESGLGRGSVFTILVPVAEPAVLRGAAEAPGVAVVPRRVYRLLVVDDNEVNLEYMSAILGNAGHVVDKAPNGPEALRLFEECPPDAAILDIQMPGMTGIELERKLRAYGGDRYDSQVPLIALTAFDPQDVEISEARFTAVFSKPVDVERLLLALDQAIDSLDAPPPHALESRWAGRPSGAAEAIASARAAVPGLLQRLREAGNSPETQGELLRNSAHALSALFEGLGAERAAAALRRLAIAREDKAVICSRIARIESIWKKLDREAPFPPNDELDGAGEKA